MRGVGAPLLWLSAHLPPPRAPHVLSLELVALPEHERFLELSALSVPPAGLREVCTLLAARGHTLVLPGADASIHPLLVPLARSPTDSEVVGLLRWPGASGGGTQLPLVRTAGAQLELLASCAEHYLARQLVLADEAEPADPDELGVLEALAASRGIRYERGAAARSPGGVPGYVITRVGPFIQEYERLAAGHLAKGAEQAGLVACERSQQCFGAWGRPLAFHAQVLYDLGRREEARDMARQALEMPLWTLGTPLDQVLAIAERTIDELVDRVQLKADGKRTMEQLRANNGMEERSPQQICKDRATYVMDLVVAAPETHDWTSTRPKLASLYKEAEMGAVASFISLEPTPKK